MQTIPFGRQVAHDKAFEIITGGNSTFTIKSIKTQVRFTFKVEFANKQQTTLCVKLLVGHDNNRDYRYMCHIEKICGVITLTQPMRSSITTQSTAFIAFQYLFIRAYMKINMPGLEFWHEGRCCRCGRKLTVPESIESGIGPECATKSSNFDRC